MNGARIITVVLSLVFAIGVMAGRASSAPTREAGEKAMGRSPTRAGGGEGDRKKNEVPGTADVWAGLLIEFTELLKKGVTNSLTMSASRRSAKPNGSIPSVCEWV